MIYRNNNFTSLILIIILLTPKTCGVLILLVILYLFFFFLFFLSKIKRITIFYILIFRIKSIIIFISGTVWPLISFKGIFVEIINTIFYRFKIIIIILIRYISTNISIIFLLIFLSSGCWFLRKFTFIFCFLFLL